MPPLRKLGIDINASVHETLCIRFAKNAGAFALLTRAANVLVNRRLPKRETRPDTSIVVMSVLLLRRVPRRLNGVLDGPQRYGDSSVFEGNVQVTYCARRAGKRAE